MPLSPNNIAFNRTRSGNFFSTHISVLSQRHSVQEKVEWLVSTWPNLDKKSRLDGIINVNYAKEYALWHWHISQAIGADI
jgi:hypothetical protein